MKNLLGIIIATFGLKLLVFIGVFNGTDRNKPIDVNIDFENKTINAKLNKVSGSKYHYKIIEGKALIENKLVNDGDIITINGDKYLVDVKINYVELNEYDLLLLEQPEIHLHPELEYKLAHFLLCIVKNKRQIIAETHSEHIINKLILSKLENNFIERLFKVYFLEKIENGLTDFKEIQISEYGEVENWPKGFFDQYLIFTKELMSKRKEIAIKKIELRKK